MTPVTNFTGIYREQDSPVCKQAGMTASILSFSVSRVTRPLSSNLSRNPGCLRAGGATIASAYTYDIAERASGPGRRIIAAQVYCTLARLVRQRRVLRIEILGAYMTCADAADLCLVCLGCRDVQLIRDDAIRPIERRAAECRFHLTLAPIEAGGLCDTCKNLHQASSADGGTTRPLAGTGSPASGAARELCYQG
jgi:Fe2+ or Zn2+ uptake regulation protein